jgi:hypothetical protein
LYQIGAVTVDQVIDNQSGFGKSAAVVLDHRRLSQRMHAPQFFRRQHRCLVALITYDFVRRAEFFQQPEHALAA